ncbi:class F sortase [Arthrobacter pigmenti]
MSGSIRGRRGSYVASAAAALILLTGCTHSAASTSAGVEEAADVAASSTPSTPVPATVTTDPGLKRPPVMAASEPVSVHIPSINVQSELLSLGLQGDGSLQVPPGDPGSPAAWYNGSPTPGERGPAILLGHVNATDGGEGVFADLEDLNAGDVVKVQRADGTTARFTVTSSAQYSKDDFPTDAVYGYTAGSELRLITCDGLDPATGEFEDNYVVYAQLNTN